MKLSDVKKILASVNELQFELPGGNLVPEHFHVTEVGQVNRHYIDCGGTIRSEKKISFQLWEANDFDHRLKPQKLADIITLSENKLSLEDLEVEVEYQSNTIGRYDLEFNGNHFVLLAKQTDCLAPDKCGIPVEKQKLSLAELQAKKNVCNPKSGCC